MSWTPEKEEKLRKLWKQGNSGSEIAKILGNTTRNAVIGVLWPFSLRGATRLHLKRLIG